VLRLSAGYSDWTYDDGNDEAALLNNIKHPEQETIGKIYYIQSYMNAGSKETEYAPNIRQNIPYKVIGINHEGTTNTVDLQAMVAVNYFKFNDNYYGWQYGRYTTSKLYDWVGSTCKNGYSSNIQAKMISMTERWREANSYTSGTLQTRSTKCKILNPFELFGSSSVSYNSGLGKVSDFTQYNYGSHYSSVFPDSISADTSRVRYHNTAMSDTCDVWTNSYYGYDSGGGYNKCFGVSTTGACSFGYVQYGTFGIAPVIRLSDSPE
jgi:hypothetical protein